MAARPVCLAAGERVAAIRQDILKRAAESDWVMDTAQLTDQAIIRRMVLKRCIYGVDKNPLAVELAKVSLGCTASPSAPRCRFWTTTCAAATPCSA